MRLTLRKRFEFGREVDFAGRDLSGPESWDSLRFTDSDAFRMAGTRDELDRRASSDPVLRERARVVAESVREVGGGGLASYGVGVAALEALLELEGLQLTLTEYAPLTVERLRALFPSADVRLHDLAVDGPLEEVSVHLFHRIDTELSDAQWRDVYRRFSHVPVIVVAAGVGTPRSFARQALLRVRRKGTVTGWMRTRSSLCALWSETHRSCGRAFGDLPGWVLRP